MFFWQILFLSRYLKPAIESVLKYKWDQGQYRGNELKNKTIGIIGYGRLGKIVAKICKSMSMNVNFFDLDSKIKTNSTAIKKTLNYILTKSDIISLHIPLNKSNKHFLSLKDFKKMKNNLKLFKTWGKLRTQPDF